VSERSQTRNPPPLELALQPAQLSGESTLAQAALYAPRVSIRALNYRQYLHEGMPALRAVFSQPEPAEAVLASGVEHAAILYPVTSLSPEQRRVIVEAAASLGDDTAWLTVLDRRTASSSRTGRGTLHVSDQDLLSLTENWLLSLDAFDHYDTLNVEGLDHAVHSLSGRWAVLISYEGHAVVGGEQRFVSEVLDLFPVDAPGATARSSVEGWLRDMRELWDALRGSETRLNPWVPKLARNVYGEGVSRELLLGNGWADFVADQPSG
jgi:hypothetical protein